MGGVLVRLPVALTLVAGLANPAFAQSTVGADKDSDGQFTGMALITDNLEWFKMFTRPEPPKFSGKSHFAPGDWGSLAMIFSNAEAKDGQALIRCDIEAFYPDEVKPVTTDKVCYDGPYRGDNILHPTQDDIRFSILPTDPTGLAGFNVTMRDVHSGREVEMQVSFTQGAAQ